MLVTSLVLASCGTKTTETTTSTSVVKTTSGKWWDKLGTPQYGGTINIREASDPNSFDPWDGRNVQRKFDLETLGMEDWTLDRNIYGFKVGYWPPEYTVGLLAENWEQPDLQTIIFHIRQGIYWQDKPPLNGRELTAADIEYSFHRQLGLGSGFTEGSPYIGIIKYAIIASVEATDKYTVIFKGTTPSLDLIEKVLDPYYNFVVPREAVEMYGDLRDWERAVGTGPFILDEYVSGSSLSFVKNQNYWGFDQRYPQNRLPYVDALKILTIPDIATTVAALRTGKIDLVESVAMTQADSLASTNPSLIQANIPARGVSLAMRVDKQPFTDIRVRTALQMAVDLDTIAKTYFKGKATGKPIGMVGEAISNAYTPFEEWPQEIKEGYMYNPDEAKKLLAEAGYTNGFKTNCVVSSTDDIDLIQILKSYLADIEIDMDIQVMESTMWTNFVRNSKKHDAMATSVHALTFSPLQCIDQFNSKHTNNVMCHTDQVYDDMISEAVESLDLTEQRELVKKADMYAMSQHWVIITPPSYSYNIYQPWLKGYSGESFFYLKGNWYARFWVDENLKKGIGQ